MKPKLFKWKRKKVVLLEDAQSSVSGTTATQTPDASPRPKDQAQSKSMQASFFQSSSNVEILGGQFSNTRGHHTNLTINFNQGGVDSIPEADFELHRVNLALAGQDCVVTEDEKPRQIDGPESGRTLLRPATPPVQRSSDIYFRHLSVKGYGYPLWIPEPNNRLPIQYQRQGIEIGDVGIVTPSGSFDFLFNILLPANNPINPTTLPEGFAPLHPSLDLMDTRGFGEFKVSSYLASSSIDRSQRDSSETSGLTFQASASEGAILAMPDGAYSCDLANIARFRRYMAANAEHWYRYVNGIRGREALNGDVRLVIGYHKTTAWGMATFADLKERTEFNLRFRPTGDSSVGRTYGWDFTGMAEVRAGPDPQEIEDLRLADGSEDGNQTYRNQCLFLRTLNVTLRGDIWDELMAELELDLEVEGDHTAESPNPPPSGSTYTGDSNDSTKEGAEETSRSAPGAQVLATTSTTRPHVVITGIPRNFSIHPSQAINKMLLSDKPEARMAITEDRDWISVLKEEDNILPSSEELCKRICQQHIMLSDQGLVYLDDITESPFNNPDAATSVRSDSETWVDSNSPSHRSLALSGTTVGGTPKSRENVDLDIEDPHVESLGLHRSRGGSVFVDPPSPRYTTGVDGIIGTDAYGLTESPPLSPSPLPPTSLHEQLSGKSKQRKTDVAEGRESDMLVWTAIDKLSERGSRRTTERLPGSHDGEVTNTRRRGLGRMLSLIRK